MNSYNQKNTEGKFYKEKKKQERQQKEKILYGIHTVKEYLKLYPDNIEKIFFTEQSKLNELSIENIKELYNCIQIENRELKEQCHLKDFENHQGIAIKTKTKWKDNCKIELENLFIECSKEGKDILWLPNIQDSNNLGAICRSVMAFKRIGGIIIPSHNSVRLSPTVAKISVGTIFHMRFGIYDRPKPLLNIIKQNDIQLIGIQKNDTAKELHTHTFDKSSKIIVLGNEEDGIPKEIQEHLTYSLEIRQNDELNSLNLSVATAIVLHHLFINSL